MTEALRKKYPKWAHRKEERKRRRKKSRRRRRRRSRSKAAPAASSSEGMLTSLLYQLLLAPRTLARKHGENVITGYADTVKPNSLAPVRSRHLMREAMREDEPGGGVGAAGAAMVGWSPVYSVQQPGDDPED